MARLLVESGDLREEEAPTHPAKGQLTRFVGMAGEPIPKARRIVVRAGDRLLLCTDGLTRMVGDQRMESLLASGESLGSTSTALIEAANASGGEDNVTVVLVSLLDQTD